MEEMTVNWRGAFLRLSVFWSVPPPIWSVIPLLCIPVRSSSSLYSRAFLLISVFRSVPPPLCFPERSSCSPEHSSTPLFQSVPPPPCFPERYSCFLEHSSTPLCSRVFLHLCVFRSVPPLLCFPELSSTSLFSGAFLLFPCEVTCGRGLVSI